MHLADTCVYVGTIDLSTALGVGTLGLVGTGIIGYVLGWWVNR